MNYSNYEKAALFENKFWLQILADYIQFFLEYLPGSEEEDTYKAKQLANIYSKLLKMVNEMPNNISQIEFSNIVIKFVNELRNFILYLLEKSLNGRTKLILTPTLMNHMVNEVDMYLSILGYLRIGRIPKLLNPVQYHIFWLLDAIGHVDMLRLNLDEVEKEQIAKINDFRKNFLVFYEKSIEVNGYLRTNMNQFPALSKLNEQVEQEIRRFIGFLKELEKDRMNHSILGTFSYLVPEHMLREECYYLTILALVTGKEKPECSPLK